MPAVVRRVVFCQHGCDIVTAVPTIEATRQRLSVRLDGPLGYTNSMPDGLRQPSSTVELAVYPVAVRASVTGKAPWASGERLPST